MSDLHISIYQIEDIMEICANLFNPVPSRTPYFSPSEGKGHTFESCRVRHFSIT